MSNSGKNEIDWQAFQTALAPIKTLNNRPLVKMKSRDFFWYSPLLERRLAKCLGDLVALPASQDELVHALRQAHDWLVPVTLRGGGTGNYGQAVPLQGGLIIDMTGLDRVLEIGAESVRVEAGCNIHKLNQVLRERGRELPVFPSTERIATVGGFIAGGSGGIGSVEHGMLRDTGNIIALSALSLECEPRLHRFSGEDVNLIHHAWGINGVITEVTLRTVPARDWINCVASFASYRAAFEAGAALAARDDLSRKLVSSVDAGIAGHFEMLDGRVGAGRHLLLALVAREDLAAFASAVDALGGNLDLAHDAVDMAATGLPSIFELAFNHTTLQVLKVDRGVTYLQVRVPAPLDAGRVEALHRKFGEEVLMHHEFIRLGGELVAIDLPVVRYSTDDRLYEIIRTYKAHGFPVFDPHTHIIEEGGMTYPDYRHLATKKRLDPRGLLNPGKSKTWPAVRDLEPEAIAALAGPEELGSVGSSER